MKLKLCSDAQEDLISDLMKLVERSYPYNKEEDIAMANDRITCYSYRYYVCSCGQVVKVESS